MLSEELRALAEPVLEKVKAHPFWAGLRDGSLPGAALARFVAQDTGLLLPAYARALTRTAAVATDDAHVALLARAATSSLEAAGRLRDAYTELAGALDAPPLGPDEPEAAPATAAHCGFFHAASAAGFTAGVGAVLPMVWFNHQVSDDLLERHTPGSRYAEWIRLYHPGEGYGYAVRAFWGLADAAGERAGAAGRAELVRAFGEGIRHEFAFAETAWSPAEWPV